MLWSYAITEVVTYWKFLAPEDPGSKHPVFAAAVVGTEAGGVHPDNVASLAATTSILRNTGYVGTTRNDAVEKLLLEVEKAMREVVELQDKK